MEKNSNQQPEMAKGEGRSSKENLQEMLKALGDFTLKENWDKFFTIRGSNDAFEWYAEWPDVQDLLTDYLEFASSGVEKPRDEVSILVPGCGSSKLSEKLYDAGFVKITNVDFSKVVITEMLKRNVRDRPLMKWRIMDMTELQFGDATFDAVLDKGGLDALMEPKVGPKLGNLYLNEVRRVLKTGGKFICLTLAESYVTDLLFSKFRVGWKMSIHAIDQGPQNGKEKLRTFVVVAEKDSTTAICDISSFLGDSVESHGNQARILFEALEKEKVIRKEYSTEVSYSIEDLRLGIKGNISVLQPGRRLKLLLGEPGVSNFFYNAMLLDAKQDSGSGQFIYPYGVFLVPQLRAHDWLYTSEEGQWLIVVSSKAARLCMVFLDSSNSIYSMDAIQSDLSPLVKQLAPGYFDDDNVMQIPFLAAGDGIKKRDLVCQVFSDLTGPIIVEDVIYEDINSDNTYKGHKYRRLTFERTENLVQSEAILSTRFDSRSSRSPASSDETGVILNYLASPYHNGIISGILLITSYSSITTLFGNLIKTVVLGLGAGLLPMFMKNNLPTLKIEVIELDPVVLDVAKEHFGFTEDDCLKVHITDGIDFVKKRADAEPEDKSLSKIDILIVDVDSSDTSTGLTCPAADFVEESFLLKAKESLTGQGLFIVNLVSRSRTMKDAVYSRLKKVFKHIFLLRIEEEVNEVLFALKSEDAIDDNLLTEARNVVARYAEKVDDKWALKARDLSKSIALIS